LRNAGPTRFRARGVPTAVTQVQGERADAFVADLAAGLTTDQTQSVAPARGGCAAQHNRLLEVEHDMGPGARQAGAALARTT
jgi:enolase